VEVFDKFLLLAHLHVDFSTFFGIIEAFIEKETPAMVSRFEQFSQALSVLTRYWHKIAADEMEKYGLKGPYSVYLITLRRHDDGLTAVQLSELCGRDKADVSRAVALMEKKDLVKKTGENPYRARLVLTRQGNEAADHVCHKATVAVEAAGRDISSQDRETFYQCLSSITGNLQALCKQGLPE
jgi:DNA-binding MarR family transcriptional regulator